MTNIEIYKKRITALIFMSAAPILGISPYLVGLVGSWLTPGCTNEANCGWAALPWFMFFTIPAALALFVFGLIRVLVALGNRLGKTGEPTPGEKKLKRYQIAWAATSSGPFLFVLAAVLSQFAGPVSVCNANEVCTPNSNGAFVNVLSVAVLLIVGCSWLYLLALPIWHRASTKREVNETTKPK